MSYCPNCGSKQTSQMAKFCSSCGSGLTVGSLPRSPEPQHIDDEEESHVDISSLDAEKFKNSVIIEVDRKAPKVTLADVFASPMDPNSMNSLPRRQADPLSKIKGKKAFLETLLSESASKRGKSAELEGGS